MLCADFMNKHKNLKLSIHNQHTFMKSLLIGIGGKMAATKWPVGKNVITSTVNDQPRGLVVTVSAY